MNKSELRKMIREEVRRAIHDEISDVVDEQIYTVLPGFIKEALGSVVQKATRNVAKRQPNQPSQPQRLVRESTGELPEDVKAKLRAKMGYGDVESMHAGVAEVPSTIAGVAMSGGLAEKEANYGQANTRDYAISPDGGAVITEGAPAGAAAAVETAPAFAHMPNFLKNAVNKAKEVYDQAEARDNWRPGMRK